MIYVCSPYKGDVEKNIAYAKQCCRDVCNVGLMPVAPHLLFTQFLDDNDSTDREMGLKFGLSLMRFCTEVWVFGDYISDGMKNEIEYANTQRKKVKYIGTGRDLQRRLSSGDAEYSRSKY